ncbi:cuticle collagen 1-like [Xiphophorus hellerii]|uniref:cuticle collagen 1-like n=1 Tax=Xiphophorus hellerii TaxID=8084 RepID=UPI0013B3978B|nr:cuticle collagen 1-like [Xiphophorus hellerii]
MVKESEDEMLLLEETPTTTIFQRIGHAFLDLGTLGVSVLGGTLGVSVSGGTLGVSVSGGTLGVSVSGAPAGEPAETGSGAPAGTPADSAWGAPAGTAAGTPADSGAATRGGEAVAVGSDAPAGMPAESGSGAPDGVAGPGDGAGSGLAEKLCGLGGRVLPFKTATAVRRSRSASSCNSASPRCGSRGIQ